MLPVDSIQGLKFGKVLTRWSATAWSTLGHVQYQGRKCLTPYKYYGMDPLQNQINPVGEKHANEWVSSA